MRIVATSDTHFPVDPAMIPDGDVFIHAGDLMSTGYLDDWHKNIAWLAALPHKIKLYVPGNHDFHLEVYPGPALQDLRKRGVMVLGLPGNSQYNTFMLPNGKRVLGAAQVLNLPRWAFNTTEENIEKYFSQYIVGVPDIVVTHQPIYGILDRSDQGNELTGSKSYLNYLKSCYVTPKYWIHGHIHEQYGKATFLDTTVYNVAMCNRKYEHANAPVVFDI